MKIYWDGDYIGAGQAGVWVGAAARFDGSALAENMRVSGGRILNFREHARRLGEGAGALLMPQPDLAGLGLACRKLLALNRLAQGSLRLRYFRDGALLIHPLPLRAFPAKPVRLMTSSVRHYGPESLQGRVKAASMLPNWLAAAEVMAWAEDGLRLTQDGFVAEGVWSNLLIEKKGVLLTPPLSQGALEGTTRAGLIRRWKAGRRLAKDWPLTRYDLYTADKIWLCSSLRGALRVATVDGRQVGT